MSKTHVLSCREGEFTVHCGFTQLMDPKGLVEHPDNNNLHSQEQIEIMKHVLRANGWRKPVLVSRSNLRIITGHLAVMTALEMGLEEIPVELQDFASRIEEVKHLTADNEIARISEFDKDAFFKTKRQMKKEMGRNEFQLSFANPNEFGLPTYPKETEEDKSKPVKEVLEIVRSGETWMLGEHRLEINHLEKHHQEPLQKFLKAWKKIHGTPATNLETGTTYDQVFKERSQVDAEPTPIKK